MPAAYVGTLEKFLTGVSIITAIEGAARTASTRRRNHEKILIVEDEENERTGLAELIFSWGYRAETARDGVEGLEKAAQWVPSIVITDLKMPRMGGIELPERLGEQSEAMAVIL